MPQIPYGKKEGEELPQDGCQGSAKDSPAKNKDKYRVKDGIDDCSGHHTEHGIFGVSVCPDEIAHAVGENEKGHPEHTAWHRAVALRLPRTALRAEGAGFRL